MAEICPFEVIPLEQSKIKATMPFKNLDYTNQEYWSLKRKILEIIRKNFQNDFVDFTESSLAVMLLECWIFLADTLSFKIDQIANELFIDTVTETENAFRLSKLFGFQPSPPVPASAMFLATVSSPFQRDVQIAAPLIMRTETSSDIKQYELYAADSNNNPVYGEPIIIPSGKVYNKSIVGIEGRTLTAFFTSTGETFQIFELPVSNVYKGSIRVAVDNVIWDQVETFTDFQPRMEYRVEWNSNYKPYVIFGNNKSGLIPPQGSKIAVNYRTGLGSRGNMITGAIDDKVYAFVAGQDHRVTVFIKNYTKGEFGYDGDGIEDIRRKLPLYMGIQNRAVTGNDYKLITEQFQTITNGMIGKATAVLRNHGCAGNIIDIYILAMEGNDDLTNASPNLKSGLNEYLNKKKMLTDHICLKDGEVVYVDIHIDVILSSFQKRFEKDIRERINRRIDDFFILSAWDYGRPLVEADIIKLLSDIQEISSFNINFTSTKGLESGDDSNVVEAKYYEIIRPDNIYLSFTYKMPEE